MRERPALEAEAIVARAQELAREKTERATTAHVLLALVVEGERTTASKILSQMELREAKVRAAMLKVGEERKGFIEQVLDRAHRIGRRPGEGSNPRAGGLQLLAALVREPDSAASRCLVEMGHDVISVGNTALSCLSIGGQKALVTLSRTARQVQASAGAAAPEQRPARERRRGAGEGPAAERKRREPGPAKEGRGVGEARRAAAKFSAASLHQAMTRPGGDRGQPADGRAPAGEEPRAAWKPRPRAGKVKADDHAGAVQALLAESMRGGERAAGASLLAKLARDLSEAARRGEIDPLVGRAREIDRIVDALNRRRGNVPCVVGDPGVGKTAIVEGLARKLALGEIQGLEGRTVLQVNVGDLIAGTGVRGALAERITTLRDEVVARQGQVVLFLDEIHSLLAATGGAAGEGAQELRSAMATGDFPCILATTPDAYRRYVDQDPGLERRLTRIDVEEPSLDEALQIVAAGSRRYAEHHGVTFTDEAIGAAVRLSQRYLTERRLPDKAFAVLDLAGARARRQALGEVGLEVVAEVVSEQTGVPRERLAASDSERLLHLERHLAERVVGHAENLARIAEALRRNAAGLGGARPVGSFLLLGPTGVGKTETARAIADALFPGSGGGMSRFDMSELSEPHSVARLVGAPPGYVGHEAGGQLTEAMRARPYQVVLLDEIEKAHPRVHMLLLQVLEDGRLTDSRGRPVDFTNAVVVMTSNLGAGAAARPAIGFGAGAAEGGAAAATLAAARAALPPELWNRFDEVLYFGALSRDQVTQVAWLLLGQTARRLERERGITLEFDPSVVELLLGSGGYDPALGARPMRRAVQRLVEAPLAEAVLAGAARAGGRLRLAAAAGHVVVAASAATP